MPPRAGAAGETHRDHLRLRRSASWARGDPTRRLGVPALGGGRSDSAGRGNRAKVVGGEGLPRISPLSRRRNRQSHLLAITLNKMFAEQRARQRAGRSAGSQGVAGKDDKGDQLLALAEDAGGRGSEAVALEEGQGPDRSRTIWKASPWFSSLMGLIILFPVKLEEMLSTLRLPAGGEGTCLPSCQPCQPSLLLGPLGDSPEALLSHSRLRSRD